MWRWIILLYLILLHRHITSQPISDDSTNDRPTRQLDFEECCPCFDKYDIHRDAGSEESLAAATEGALFRPRNVDDCPCRDREPDAQGASSVFFPAAMRTAGTFLRPAEKKEDLKPLFNPEVDLASSVLQTLREVTDEEYQDALARDAAKSAAKAAEDILIGDSTPQESANIVTIVVNPRASDDDDDVIPQASNIKQSRCIHPLQGAVGKMRMAAKPNLFVYKPRLSKAKPTLLHNIFDNGMGASNVHEHIVPHNEDTGTMSTDTSPLRVLDSHDLISPSTNNDAGDNFEVNVPDFISNFGKNKKLELNGSPLLDSIRNKIDGSLSRKSNRRRNYFTEKSRKSVGDLNGVSTTVNDQTANKVSFFKTSSVLESIKQKSRPLSITNLLNLKDVEIIPAKDLIKNIETDKINKSKLILPSILDNTERSFNSDGEEPVSWQNSQLVPKNNAIEGISTDPEESASFVNVQVCSKDDDNEQIKENCDEEVSEWKSETKASQDDLKPITTEVFATLPMNNDELAKEASNENNDCLDSKMIDQDSITDSSNNINNIIEKQETVQEHDVKLLEDEKRTPNESCDEEEKDVSTSQDSIINNENKLKLKRLDSSLVDKTISNIKENIAKKLEDLKNSFRNKDVLNREVINAVDDNKDVPMGSNENSNENEASMQVTTILPGLSNGDSEDVTTTIKPDVFKNSEDIGTLKTVKSNDLEDRITLKPDINDSTEDGSECSDIVVSLQDLQRLSDSMLQQEEQNRESKNFENNKYSGEVIVEPLKIKSMEEDTPDSNTSPNTVIEVVRGPANLVNSRETLKTDQSNDLEDIIILKPDINDSTEDGSECSDIVVSLQDLQKLSDSMLQQEEQNRESKNVENNKYSGEAIAEPPKTKNMEEDTPDLNTSPNTVIEVVRGPENLVIPRENGNEVASCKSNLVSPKPQVVLDQTDANVDASDIVVSTVVKSNDIVSSQPILQPAEISLKTSLPDVNDLLKLPTLNPLPSMQDIKVKLTNLFNKNNRNIEITSSSESRTTGFEGPQDTSNADPVMTSAASTSNFRSRVPSSRILKDINLKRLDLKPQSGILPGIPNIGLQSYKTKLPIPKDLSLKPIKLQTPLNDKHSLLSTSNIGGKNNHLNINKYDNVRPSDKASSIFNNPLNIYPRTGDVMERLTDSPLEATNHIHSTLRNTQKAFESRLKQAINNNFDWLRTPTKSSSSLLDSLSRNYEDISDKLKGLHMDLNDRLETMRNELIDRSKLFTSGSRNSKQNFINIGKQNKGKQPLKSTWQASSRRESQKMSTPRKLAQNKPVKITSPSKTVKQNTYRLRGAASVPVPSTIQVPELKTASENNVPIALARKSNIALDWNTNILQNKETPNIFDRKPFNTKKDSKVLVSFSTTPRPAMMDKFRSSSPHLQKSSSSGKSHRELASRITNEDNDGSPSELKKSSVSAPALYNLNRQIYLNIGQESDVPSQNTGVSKDATLNASEMANLSTKSILQSWPRASESSFIKKVKEAVQTRLSKVNSSKSLKQTALQGNEEKDDKEPRDSSFDMARSASENKEIINESPLKENVSYKCKMVCTKEHM